MINVLKTFNNCNTSGVSNATISVMLVVIQLPFPYNLSYVGYSIAIYVGYSIAISLQLIVSNATTSVMLVIQLPFPYN
jgi:hypothetical protein